MCIMYMKPVTIVNNSKVSLENLKKKKLWDKGTNKQASKTQIVNNGLGASCLRHQEGISTQEIAE